MKRFQLYLDPNSVAIIDDFERFAGISRSKMLRAAIDRLADNLGKLLATKTADSTKSIILDRLIGSIILSGKKETNFAQKNDMTYLADWNDSMKVFIDTGVFITLFIKQEKFHLRVTAKYEEYKKERARIITSDYVLDELFTRLIYDFARPQTEIVVNTLLAAEKAEEMAVVRIDELMFQKAVKTLVTFAEHKLSFTDAASYVCCKEFGIDEIFTLDKDFNKVGLTVSTI